MTKKAFKVFNDCWRRIVKANAFEHPEDIKRFFRKHSHDGTMTVDDLLDFLVATQGEKAKVEDAQAILDSLKHLNIFQRKGLNLKAFFKYLLSDRNLAHSPSSEVHHDMNAPLAHYFIYTSHNSYLTGNQLSSVSSAKPIAKALRRGVRVIELDLLPNSKGDDVVVCHGGIRNRIRTSAVKLRKCLHAIKKNAFSASDYPVVITFENHLNSYLQKRVAKLVHKIFGDMLFTTGSENMQNFPSPEFLKKQILISTKPPLKDYLESLIIRRKEVQKETKPEGKKTGATQKENIEAKRKASDKEKRTDEGEHVKEENEEKAVPEYKRLIAIHAGKQQGRTSNWLSDDPRRVTRVSLSEEELNSAVEQYRDQMIRFTQRNFLRVFPKATRFDSSNYNPFVGWMHGAQMVAFNMQGHGKYLWTMQGMFRANGGCGYVKKPEFLLKMSPNDEVLKPTIFKKVLKVKVYLGQGWNLDFHRRHFNRDSPPDFYARVGIAGVPADETMEKTSIRKNDWLPVWDEEFEFPLTVPELALLLIEVKEYGDTGKPTFGGQTCLPVLELRTGVRAVPLYSKKGDRYEHVRLLVRITFEVPPSADNPLSDD